MASIRQAAQNVIDEARDGIAWIALWKEGKGWQSESFWPEDYNDHTGLFTFDAYDRERLAVILATDELAAFVNSYYRNLGDTSCMTRDCLATALRWQYELGHSRLSDAVQNCAE